MRIIWSRFCLSFNEEDEEEEEEEEKHVDSFNIYKEAPR